jgi:hypothetical protein
VAVVCEYDGDGSGFAEVDGGVDVGKNWSSAQDVVLEFFF